MTPAERLLTDLRARGIGVRLDGDVIRCKAPDGVIPADLAQRIRDFKPQLLVLLMETEAQIAWRIAQIGAELLADAPDAEAGICPWCWMSTPGRVGKCVLCALASAAVADRLRREVQTTDPLRSTRRSSGDLSSEPERLAS